MSTFHVIDLDVLAELLDAGDANVDHIASAGVRAGLALLDDPDPAMAMHPHVIALFVRAAEAVAPDADPGDDSPSFDASVAAALWRVVSYCRICAGTVSHVLDHTDGDAAQRWTADVLDDLAAYLRAAYIAPVADALL